jgi:hypothetical protein
MNKILTVVAAIWVLASCASYPPSDGHHVVKLTSGPLAGTTCDCNWFRGELSGPGTIIYQNGDKYTTDWTMGRRGSTGKYEWKNGDVYEGELDIGNITGHGTLTLADGTKTTGRWLDGKLVEKDPPIKPKGYCDEHPFMCIGGAILGVAVVAAAVNGLSQAAAPEQDPKEEQPSGPSTRVCSTASGSCLSWSVSGQSCSCYHSGIGKTEFGTAW